MAEAGVSPRLSWADADFWAAPFPSADRVAGDGRIALDNVALPANATYVRDILPMLADARGFATAATIYFPLDGPIGAPTLPTPAESVQPDSTVFLVDIDPAGSGRGARSAVSTYYADDPGPYGPANLLSLQPVQGAPLRPKRRYVAVVMRAAGGQTPLGRSATMAALLRGETPAGWPDDGATIYHEALEALAELDVDLVGVAGLTVFTTGDPSAELGRFVDDALGQQPRPPAALRWLETFNDFCVYESEVELPVYQTGTPPFATPAQGGGWAVTSEGAPALVDWAPARIVVTVPRQPAPAAGYPVALFVRTGGGGDRPLVDRGVRQTPGGPSPPGTGPAVNLARVGWAGVQIDGPHGGPRNVSQGDEQFLMFNITNLWAMRDNIRQAALEVALWPDIVAQLGTIDGGCEGAPAASGFDADTITLFGHSMGSWIAPLALAVRPVRFTATVWSGAGASWVENIMYKRSPVAVRPFAEALLGYYSNRDLHPHDPALMWVQWALEPADPQVYGAAVAASDVHVLMLQGVVDTYILPPIARATSLASRLVLAGDAIDGHDGFTPFDTWSEIFERPTVSLPIAADGQRVAVVVQHRQGPIEDGHEVMFQTDGPKHQYQCFLAGLASGAPGVPVAGAQTDACD